MVYTGVRKQTLAPAIPKNSESELHFLFHVQFVVKCGGINERDSHNGYFLALIVDAMDSIDAITHPGHLR